MKKIFALIPFIVISSICFAQNTETINTLISADINKNYDSIREESENLTESERIAIFQRHEKNRWLGGTVNLLINLVLQSNFGIGNFMQGDMLGGTITLSGNFAGMGLVALGIFGLSAGIPYAGPVGIFGGVATSISFSIFGIVRAFVYPRLYNNKLRGALWIGQVELDIKPSLSMTGQKHELTLVKLHY